ncbi:zgc:172076 [Clupea harengus]|uniref:creatine kinase n=1 Tax=Clupea harengus TaxID=7950 RepID=A0A6P3W760_CLUHA|nr:zgc:172076 [Clupea harengus]
MLRSQRKWMKFKSPLEFPKEVKYKPILESLQPIDPMSRFNLHRGSPAEEFPYLRDNHTYMGHILTLHLYTRQFNRATESGVMFDDIIRPGLEDPGQATGPMAVGCLAGDAQSYILFCDFFDRIIDAYHDYKITSSQESDFNCGNLKGGDVLDAAYAVDCEVRVARCVEDFCFPMHCSRAERRKLLSLAEKALTKLSEEFPGKLYSMEELSQDAGGKGLAMMTPTPAMVKIGVARDWPDARAVWESQDGQLVVWVNFEDHLKLECSRTDANLQLAFDCICLNLLKLESLYKTLRHPFVWKEHLGWVVSSPAEVGTGLKASVTVRLQHLPNHKRLENVLDRLRLHLIPTDKPGLYRATNAPTIGFSEVGVLQLVVDGVQLLICMEKRLENHGGIDDLVPTHKLSGYTDKS